MLIKEEINRSNRMEVGPGEHKITIKCDRCGKMKPKNTLEAVLWYCDDYEKEMFFGYKYQNKNESDEQVDYCPDCIQSNHEKEIVLRGIRHEIQAMTKQGWQIGSNLQSLINMQINFQKDCQWFMDTLNSFNEFKTDLIKKKIRTALDYSCVDFPSHTEAKHVQLSLF